jgi:hypothetical protein
MLMSQMSLFAVAGETVLAALYARHPQDQEPIGSRISLAFRVKPARDSADQAGFYR